MKQLSLLTTFILLFSFLAKTTEAQSLQFKTIIPTETSLAGGKVSSIAANSKGELYLCNQSAGVIHHVDAYGVQLRTIKVISIGTSKISLEVPKLICVDNNDRLIIYDEELGKIFVVNANGRTFSFGENGSGAGKFEKVVSITADTDGYIYVLNSGRKQIDVYSSDGIYLTNIIGGVVDFVNPTVISCNKNNEIYVLDKAEPCMLMFDASTKMINSARNLANKSSAVIKNPISMTASPNGDFFLLDGDNMSITQFNRLGDVIGTFGTVGAFGAGTFENALLLTSSMDEANNIYVYDFNARKTQIVSYAPGNSVMMVPYKKIRVTETGTSKSSMLQYTSSKGGKRYVIQADQPSSIIAFKDTSAVAQLIIQNKISEVTDMACDSKGSLFACDAKERSIIVFDSTGIVTRKIGQDIPEKLKHPTSLSFRSNGELLVCDHSNGLIHLWKSNGTYDKVFIDKKNTGISSPYKIKVGSKDQIFIWDNKENCIYKVAASGWPVALKKLYARPEKQGGKPGNIIDFYLDPLDQIHLLNESTGQLEIYTWDEDPDLRFSFGRKGEGISSMENVQHIHFDQGTFVVYASIGKGKPVKALRLSLQPPKPTNNISFDIKDDKLAVVYEEVKSNSVVGYALITTSVSGRDSLAAKVSSGPLLLSKDDSKIPRLRSYRLISLSPTDASEATDGFKDYFQYGLKLLQTGNYEDALSAFQDLQKEMKCSQNLKAFIAKKIAIKCEELAKDGDAITALSLIRNAFSLDQESEPVKTAYTKVYQAYFLHLSNRNEFNAILQEAEKFKKADAMRNIAFTAVDSLSSYLTSLPNEKSISNGMYLQKKLTEWAPENFYYWGSLAQSGFKMYQYKQLIGEPSFELVSILQEAEKNGTTALQGLKKNNVPHYEVLINQVQILNALGKYDETEKILRTEFLQNSVAMGPQNNYKLKLLLAQAYSKQGKHDLAANEYEKILKENEENVEVQNQYAEALLLNGKTQEAKAIYQRLLIADRLNPQYISKVGEIELRNKNFVEASFQLEKAIKLAPSEKSYYGLLAEAFQGSDNIKRALECYAIAIPYEEKRLQESKDRFLPDADVKAILEKLNSYLMSSAKLHEQLGQYDESIADYKRVLEVENTNDAAFYGLGKANLNAGFIYDAVNAFYSACKIAPNNEVYSNAHSAALKLRDQKSKSNDALEIVSMQFKDIYPSLYRNYADLKLLSIGEIIVANNSAQPITPMGISVFVSTLMDQPSKLISPALVGYSNSALSIGAIFNQKILDITTDQKLQIDVEVIYKNNGQTRTAKKSGMLTVHGRNAISWKDKRCLASFITPNSEFMSSYGKQADLFFSEEPGYGLPKNILKAIQLYTLCNRLGFRYTPDPNYVFATVSTNTDILDYLQFPAETMQKKTGDCDDLVAMYCSLLENAGVSTAYIDVPGHVFMAFDSRIRPSELVESGLNPLEVIIHDDKVWIPVETTLLGKNTFLTAWKTAASRYYKELTAGNFPEIVPLSDARAVYVPAEFQPAGFVEIPQGTEEMISEYNEQIAQLLVVIKKEIITEMENRYLTEPDNVFVKNKYATLLAQTGSEEKAEKIYLEALELSPNSPIILNNLGNLYFLQGLGSKSTSYYEQAWSKDNSDPEILINLTKSELLNGNKTKAQQYFAQAIQINPKLESDYSTLKLQLR